MTRVCRAENGIQRIVVRVTTHEKQMIVCRARQLNMTASELMRKAAAEYLPINEDLVELAKAAQESAARSMAMMDETSRFTAASSARITAMELKGKADRQEIRAHMAKAPTAD